MPANNSKSVLSFLATLILFLGFAGMVSPNEPVEPIAQTGFSKGLSSPAVEYPAADPPAAPTASMQPSNKKFAVVIGIVYDNYELGSISYADQDAGSVYSLLTGKLGFAKENVKLLQNSQASRQNILGALDWLAHNPDIDADSDVVLFYSGHGLRSAPNVGLNLPGVQSAYALVPFDFMAFDYKKGQGLLWDSELAGYLGGIRAGRMWIDIDSCSSGGFNRPGITGPNRIVTMSSRGDELSNEIPEVQRGAMVQYMIEEGVARGMTIEQAFAVAAPRANLGFGQNPQIADDYPGNMDLGKSPQMPIT
jgi:hypothetical protein